MLNLPNELYYHILPFLDVQTLVNFSLANKRIYSLCAPCIATHKELHLKWTRIDYSHEQSISFAEVLTACLSDPRINWYVLDYTSYSWWQNEKIEPARESHLYDLILTSPTISDDSRPQWLSALTLTNENEGPQPLEALLVTMLPNLRTLRIPTNAGTEYFTNVFSAAKYSFSHLRTIELGYGEPQHGVDANHIIGFTQLPYLERIHGSNIMSYDHTYDDDFTSPIRSEHTCPLVDLELGGGITAGCLAAILRGVRNEDGYGLQRFIYCRHPVDTEFGSDHFNGPLFMEALAKYASHSLVVLELEFDEFYYELYLIHVDQPFHDEDLVISVGPGLKKLDHLRILKIGCEMLVNEEWMREEVYEKTNRTSDNETPLAEILPSSLETLSVLGSGIFDHALDVALQKLVVLLRDSSEAVPKLKAIEISFDASGSSLFDELASICKDNGVQLELEGEGLYKTCMEQVKIGLQANIKVVEGNRI